MLARAVCPLVRIAGMAATGGIYAAPTRQYYFVYGISGRFVGNGLDRSVRFAR